MSPIKPIATAVLGLVLGLALGLTAQRTGLARRALNTITGTMSHADLREAIYNALPVPAGHVLVLGDSNAERVDWAAALGRPATHRAYAGNTAERQRTRAAASVRVVVIMLGANDLLTGRSASEVAGDLFLIAEAYRSGGATVVMVGQVIERADLAVAAEHVDALLRFVDLAPVAVRDVAPATVDGVHLTPAAYRALFSRLQERLP